PAGRPEARTSGAAMPKRPGGLGMRRGSVRNAETERQAGLRVDPLFARVIASADESLDASRHPPSAAHRACPRGPRARRSRLAPRPAIAGFHLAHRWTRALDRAPGRPGAPPPWGPVLSGAAPRGRLAGRRVPVARARRVGG